MQNGDVVRRQYLCDAVFLDAVRYRVLVETQIDEMGLGVVADHKLRKAVRVGIFQNQQLAPPLPETTVADWLEFRNVAYCFLLKYFRS